MTDYETKYRDLVAGLEALADEWDQHNEGSESWRVFGPQVISVPHAVTALRALLASSPAEKPETDPADAALGYLNRLRTMDPSPSLTRAIDEVEREVRAASPAEREGEGEPDGCRLNGCHPAPGSSGAAGESQTCPACRHPQHLGYCSPFPPRPAPVVTPITEGGEQP